MQEETVEIFSLIMKIGGLENFRQESLKATGIAAHHLLRELQGMDGGESFGKDGQKTKHILNREPYTHSA